MADPVLITITPKDAWQKVATAKTVGRFIIKNSDPDHYFYTYVDTGSAAPTTTPIPFGNLIDDQVEFANNASADFYIYAKGAIGQIEAQL